MNYMLAYLWKKKVLVQLKFAQSSYSYVCLLLHLHQKISRVRIVCGTKHHQNAQQQRPCFSSHLEQNLCAQATEPLCAHRIIDLWVKLAKKYNVSFDTGLLFPSIQPDGTIKMEKRWGCKEHKDTLEKRKRLISIFLFNFALSDAPGTRKSL